MSSTEDDTQRDSLTFIGTATTVLRIGSFTVLTDPNFLRSGRRTGRQPGCLRSYDRCRAGHDSLPSVR